MNFVKFIDLLENKRLWLARADLLDDPREARLTRLELSQLQQANREIAEYNLRRFEESRLDTFINSWTENAESIALWDLYAGSPGGVAIKSTIGRLKKAVNPSSVNVHIGRIQYLDWGSATWPNNVIGFAVRKAAGYLHEGEIRVVTCLRTSNVPPDANADFSTLVSLANVVREPLRRCGEAERRAWKQMLTDAQTKAQRDCSPKGISLQVDLSVLTNEVVIGPRGSAWFGLVENVLRRYGMFEITIRQSELTPGGVYK